MMLTSSVQLFFFGRSLLPPNSTLFPYTTLFRSGQVNFNEPASVGTATFLGGTLGGWGETTIALMAWLGVVFCVLGTTIIPLTGVLNISGNADKTLTSRTLLNRCRVVSAGSADIV